MQLTQAILPLAGLGTRFLPWTKVVPKELLPIGNKPAIQYIVEEAVASGIEEIVLVLSRSKLLLLDYFKSDSTITWPVKFTPVFQEAPLGLGHAVLCARPEIGNETFLVMLPDVVIDHQPVASRQLMTACSEGWGLLLEKVRPELVSSYGIINGEEVRPGLFTIRGAVEKPKPEKAPSDLGILGRYLFPPEIFDMIEKSGPGAFDEIQLTDGIDALAKKIPGQGVICQGAIFDTGTPEGLLRAANYYATLVRP